jgi:hypothetical protein
VPLMPQRHTHLSCALNLPKIQFVSYAQGEFQYNDLKALGCLPYPVVQPSMRSRGHLRNVLYGGFEALGCLPYQDVRLSTRSRDHLRT